MSLPFQCNWFHLIWSSDEKVIAFQDLPLCWFLVQSLRGFGPESPAPGFVAQCLARGACGIGVRSWSGVTPEFPYWPESTAFVVRSLRFESSATVFSCSSGSGVSALLVRSLRPGRSLRPSWSGVSGVSWLQRLFFWEGYLYPSTYLQPLSSSKHVFPLLSPPLLTLESLPLSQFLP